MPHFGVSHITTYTSYKEKLTSGMLFKHTNGERASLDQVLTFIVMLFSMPLL